MSGWRVSEWVDEWMSGWVGGWMGQLDVDVIGMVMGCCWIDGGLPILGLPLPLPLPLQRGRLPHPDRAPLRSVRAPFSGSGHRSPVPCVPDPKRPSSSP